MEQSLPMPELSDVELALLHDVRLRGIVKVQGAGFGRLETLGLVATRGDFVALTADGRASHAIWARFKDGSAAHEAAVGLFNGFDELNRELLSVCTAWQVRVGGVQNDHSDVAYDWQVIRRLERLHERSAPRIRRLARDAPRFMTYDSTFRFALKNVVDDGAVEWFTSPSIDSFHTLWNRLHEDLLLALGIERES